MRSLNQVLGLLLVLVPGLAASCSGDESNSATANGGEGLGGEGAGATSGAHSSGGKNSNGTAGEAADAGEANQGGNATGGQAGDGPIVAGGASSGGGGEGGSSGNAGEPGTNAGAGGEGGAPAAPGPLIVFDAGPHNGLNFGGRLGLDQHCATAKLAQTIAGTKTHALISVSASDEMRDMPALYGVPTNRALVSKTGQQIADNWPDLLDGSIDQSLMAAGVSSADFWISGSNTDGSVRSTCNGWTTSQFSEQVMGTYGYPSSANSLWITITDGEVYCSSSQYNVICLAYD